MAINIAGLVGKQLTTVRALAVDVAGLSYEARRRNPEPSDFLLPAGTVVEAREVEAGRLIVDAGDYGLVRLHPNHVPESGTSYRSSRPQGSPSQGLSRAVQADPEVADLVERLEKAKALKAARSAAEAKAAMMAKLLKELAVLEAEEQLEA